jgi:hypothetical protein
MISMTCFGHRFPVAYCVATRLTSKNKSWLVQWRNILSRGQRPLKVPASDGRGVARTIVQSPPRGLGRLTSSSSSSGSCCGQTSLCYASALQVSSIGDGKGIALADGDGEWEWRSGMGMGMGDPCNLISRNSIRSGVYGSSHVLESRKQPRSRLRDTCSVRQVPAVGSPMLELSSSPRPSLAPSSWPISSRQDAVDARTMNPS